MTGLEMLMIASTFLMRVLEPCFAWVIHSEGIPTAKRADI